jgi:O-antigen/teichoic acid export membrane protein
MGIAAAGRYQPGYQLATLLMFIPRCGDMLLPPILGKLVDSGDRAGAKRLASDFLHFFIMIAIPFAVGATLAGPSIIALLANSETAEMSRWVPCLVVVGTTLYGVSVLYYQGAYVLGRMRLVMIANLIGVTLNLTLNAVLLHFFRNLTVAAVASLLSYGATTLYVVNALRAEWSFELDWPRIAKFFAATLVMGVALYAFGLRPLSISPLSVWTLLGAIGTGVAIYFGVLALLGGLGLQLISRIAENRSTAG